MILPLNKMRSACTGVEISRVERSAIAADGDAVYSKRRSIPGGEDMKYKNFPGVAPVFSTLYFQPVG